MKVIFLDIDGVMNNRQFTIYCIEQLRMRDMGMRLFDPISVRALNKILDETGAKIVISSTWRKLYDFEEMGARLFRQGVTTALDRVIASTPSSNTGRRGLEIEEWLSENEVEDYVIIDDDSDIEPLKHKWVKTSFDIGMQEEHAIEVIKRLNTGEGNGIDK